jgi:hypothetical protein
MANILNNFLKQATTGDQLKDWRHASDLYLANGYQLLPKPSFLYHVFFDINTDVVSNTYSELADNNKVVELGMLVKQVTLPHFNIDTKVLNAYNRPNIIQNKIHYEPVTITFHDDTDNRVRNFWYDYYSYYYRDSDYGSVSNLGPITGVHSEMSNVRDYKNWGYTIRGSENGTTVTTPYLKAIRIYSLSNKKFSEFTLMNPMIKTFQHGDHNSSSYTETLTHTMTVEFESVHYGYGNISPDTVKGFGTLHYDKSPSPLTPAGGGSKSIMGPGGVVNSADEIIHDLNSGNYGAALVKASRVGNTLKGANLGAMALSEASALLPGLLSGSNPFGTISLPSVSGLMTGIGTSLSKVAGSSILSALNSKPGIPSANSSDITSTITGTTTGLTPATATDTALSSFNNAMTNKTAVNDALQVAQIAQDAAIKQSVTDQLMAMPSVADIRTPNNSSSLLGMYQGQNGV